MQPINNIIENLKENGSVKIENILQEEELIQIKKIILGINQSFHNKETIFATNFKSLLIKLFKLDFKKFTESLELINLSQKKKFDQISTKFFNKKENIHMIDGYVSKKSNINIIDWHCDQPYYKEKISSNRHDKRSLKFFIYLTDVDTNNGCLAYIPNSHKIVYLVKKMIFEKKIEQRPFKHLKECRDFISEPENLKKILNESENEDEVFKFLDDTKFCEKNKDTNVFDYKMKAGDVIIFDENGFHRGSKPTKTDRAVLRYHYGSK